MTLHVVALDAEQFKEKFLSHPNPAERLGFGPQMQAANQILKRCIEECQIVRFAGSIIIPEKPIFDGWAGAIPDLEKVKNCLNFLREMQSPRAAKENNPWWIKQSSFPGALFPPQSVQDFVVGMHECKFFELFLANIISGESVYDFIELGEFLELSAVNGCVILAWLQQDKKD